MTVKQLFSITVMNMVYLGVPTTMEMAHTTIILNAFGKYMHGHIKLFNCSSSNSIWKRIHGVDLTK